MNVIKNDKDYRTDIASLLLTRLINYATIYAESNPIEQKHIDRLIFLVNHEKIFTNDLKYHLVKKIINANKTKFAKLIFDKTVQMYVTK